MKNIDKMTKKELAHQIFMSKVRSGKQNLMDKHTKPELKTMLQKEIKKTATKPKTAKPAPQKKTAPKSTKRVVKQTKKK